MTLRSLGLAADYLSARRILSSDNLRLPSSVLLDGLLCQSDEWRNHRFPAWGRELVAYPNRYCHFEKGKDLADIHTDWILPASYVPESAYGRKFAGLLIDPEEISLENGRQVIHPFSVSLLANFIQISGYGGKSDDKTGIPTNVPPGTWMRLPEIERRWLIRMNTMAIRPIMRLVCGESFRRHVHGACSPYEHLHILAEKA
jgi:hypothetical protein